MQKLQPQKEILVDGDKYVVQFYSPTFGLTLYAKLLRLLGEPLVKMMGVFRGKNAGDILSVDLGSLNLDSAGEAIASLFGKLPPEEMPELIKEILSSTYFHPSLEPVAGRFETAFMGQYLHLFKLVAKTLGAQYPDFLSVIVKRANAVKAAPGTMPENSETPKA